MLHGTRVPLAFPVHTQEARSRIELAVQGVLPVSRFHLQCRVQIRPVLAT